MNSGVPRTDVVYECYIGVDKPKSPILISPEFELIKILSHFRSLWMIGWGF